MVAISIIILCVFLIWDFASAIATFNDSLKYIVYVRQAVIKAVVIALLTMSLAQ